MTAEGQEASGGAARGSRATGAGPGAAGSGAGPGAAAQRAELRGWLGMVLLAAAFAIPAMTRLRAKCHVLVQR